MMISVIGIKFFCQLYLRRLGPSPYLQPTRERESESESDSESDSADTEVVAFGWPALLEDFMSATALRLRLHEADRIFGRPNI